MKKSLIAFSGADHIALPSTEQEKLDREWEYFETVCDQVFFILVSRARLPLCTGQDMPLLGL